MKIYIAIMMMPVMAYILYKATEWKEQTMSRWIDIDDISLLKTVSVGGLSAKALWKRIRQQPSIDLVTCAECKYWQDNNGGYPTTECRWGHDETPDAEDFCSFGERKESE